MTTHFALIGYEYAPDVLRVGTVRLGSKPRPPGIRAVREHRHPTVTLCGLSVARGARATIALHDDPATCRKCLQALPSRPTDRVQPVTWDESQCQEVA